jgi:hypothetical protein
VPGLLTAAIVLGRSWLPSCRTIPGWRAWCRARGAGRGGVPAGAATVFAVHVVPAVTCGSLLGLLPHRIMQIAVAVVFLAGAVLVLRGDQDDDDEARLKAARPRSGQ